MSGGKPFPVSSAYSTHNEVQLIRGGADYFETLLELVNNAQYSVHLQTYIFDADETGTMVANALMDAARRGVQVYLLLDGYASQHLPEPFILQLKQSGIFFRWFEPVFRSRRFYVGRRLHHKLLVVDAVHSMVAGVNISNRYNDMPGQKAWLDWAVHAKGEVSAELFNLCVEVWNKAGWGKKRKHQLQSEAQLHLRGKECLVRVRRNDWVRRKNQISRSYLEMFRKATSHITMMSSYFLPGAAFRRNLAHAAKRGVVIKVITAGTSDISMAKHAERYLYRWMFRNNIQLYEYQPNVLHGKLSTYDTRFVTIGSYNINNISAYASIELNLDVQHAAFAQQAEQALEEIITKDCVQITEKEFEKHNTLIKRIWQRICYEMIRLIFFLFTFYFRQRS
ncbi:phospholipase [Lacibacter luteus]|uniref:Phospholipase n=1 Tax=Lacibacter luteus TaxID=2508719 RepID=A0A4Q1CPJ0_9BACT|nr:phospholipase D-like domain-containing protein [Lacibacter luteus]RXK62641.1 phospholipase [Lacibacter luteus]